MKQEDVMTCVGLTLIVAPLVCVGICLIIFAPWQATAAIFCVASFIVGAATLNAIE